MEETIIELITYAGNARSSAILALRAARERNFEKAKELLSEADESMAEAHRSQTDLLTREARGEKTAVTLLMVHAQDHVMNAMTVKDMAAEMIEIMKGVKA